MRGLPYEVKGLVFKAREAALLAVETYNRPTATFRSGAYVVLMNIAWTSLFHACFLRRGVKPFYKKKNSNRYEKVDGEPKRWEISECLQQHFKADNPAIRQNLEFFIGLRNKIEHCALAQLDAELFGECQSMLLNFENLLVSEFGERFALGAGLSFALQFSKGVHKASAAAKGADAKAFKTVKGYVDKFRSSLSADIQSSLEYSFKVYLVPKIGNHPSSDSVAVEFIKYDPNKPDEMRQYEKIIAMIKPKEVAVLNQGYLKPTQVAEEVASKLGKKFSTHDHTLCHRHFNVRPAKNAPDPTACDTRYCVYDSVHRDYVYSPAWVALLVEKLKQEATYQSVLKPIPESGTADQVAP